MAISKFFRIFALKSQLTTKTNHDEETISDRHAPRCHRAERTGSGLERAGVQAD